MTPAQPVCRLCQLPKTLCESHILPEFAYKPTYDEGHRSLSFNPDKLEMRFRRKGFWEELLCLGCEGHIGAWESYFAEIWFNKPRRPRVLPDQVTLDGLDYARIKLLLLSILWRASVSSLKEFRGVKLGAHEERIRACLFTKARIPESQYPVAALAMRDPVTRGFMDQLIQLPSRGKVAGHTVYRMLFGGVFWLIRVSSHRRDDPVPIMLKEDGTLTLLAQDWDKNRPVLRMAADVKRYDQLQEDRAPEDRR